MTKSNSIESYPHCKNIWDEAYASSTGTILVTGDKPMTKSEQATLIGDLLHYRVLVRKTNAALFPPGAPQYMTSIFDPFTVTKITGEVLGVRIKRRTAQAFKITNIEEVDYK